MTRPGMLALCFSTVLLTAACRARPSEGELTGDVETVSDAVCGSPCTSACASDCAQTTQVCNSSLWTTPIYWRAAFDTSVNASLYANLKSAASIWTTGAGSVTFMETKSTSVTPRVDIATRTANGGRCNRGSPGSGGVSSCEINPAMGLDGVVHELGHVIGLNHEHIRSDRDQYIIVDASNFACESTGMGNFGDNWWKCNSGSSSDFGYYDVTSVMHYSGMFDRGCAALPSPGAANSKDFSNVREMYSAQLGWQKFWPLGFTGITPIGDPALTTQGGSGNLDMFVRASDNKIYHRYASGGNWSTSWSLQGDVVWTTNPTATSWGTGTSFIVAAYYDNMYSRVFANGGWQWWQALPALPEGISGSPAVAASSQSPGKARVFFRTAGGSIYTSEYTSVSPFTSGSWGAWTLVPGGAITSSGSPAATSQGADQYDVFVVGDDQHIYHTFRTTGGWAGWWEDNSCCAQPGSTPAATSWGAGRVDLLYKGANGQMWWRYFANGTWSPTTPPGGGDLALGGLPGSSPAAVARGPNHIDLVVRGSGTVQQSELWQRWLN